MGLSLTESFAGTSTATRSARTSAAARRALEVRIRKNENFRLKFKGWVLGLSAGGGLLGALAGHFADLAGWGQ